MAQYTLGVPTCFIEAIRSVFSDTLVASTALRVMNAQGALHQDWPMQSINLGDHGPGTVISPNLFYQNVDVPDPTEALPDGGAIYWSFLLVNAGYGDSSAVVGALNNAANAVVGALVSSGNIMAEIAAGGIIGAQALLQLLTPDCDGMVAAFGVGFTAAELAQMTASPQNWTHSLNFPGIASQVGCGGNSNYNVTYIIANRAQVTVPNLIRQSPATAQHLVEQAGLSFSSSSSQTGAPNKPPSVEGQTPSAGSQVLPGSYVEAWIVLPVSGGHLTP